MKSDGANGVKLTQPLNADSLSSWTIVQRTKSVIEVTPEFHIYQTKPKPNAWIRFWYRVFLGWKWRDYE